MAAVQRQGAEVHSAFTAGLDELSGLETPDSLTKQVATLVAALDRAGTDIDEVTAGAAAGDLDAVSAAALAAGGDFDAVDAAAADLGVASCTSETWGRVFVIEAGDLAAAARSGG